MTHVTYDYIWPWPKGTVASQEFGSFPGGVNPVGGHTGLDAALAAGTPLRAPRAGRVVFEGWANLNNNPYLLTDGGGICLVIDFGDGMPACVMGHLSATFVSKGDWVEQGQVVAESGNTGRWTTGPHCHLEFLPPVYSLTTPTYGRVNPRDYCTGYYEDTLEPVLLGYQRLSETKVWQRTAPEHRNDSNRVKLWDEGLVFDFDGWTLGSAPYDDGNAVWFHGRYSDTWMHSSAFKDKGTHDLAEIKRPPPPPPPVPYEFTLELGVVNGITVEKLPAALSNVNLTDFPADPEVAVCHWWNSLDKAPTFESAVGEFQKIGTEKSAHVVIGVDRIAQMVGFNHRAFHAGPGGNGWFGLEIDPVATERGADGKYTARALKVQANVRGVLIALRDLKKRKHKLMLHKDVPGAATTCSDLDLATFDIPGITPDNPPPPPPPAKVPPAATDPISKLVEFYKE